MVFGRFAEFAGFSILSEGVLQIQLGLWLHFSITKPLKKKETD